MIKNYSSYIDGLKIGLKMGKCVITSTCVFLIKFMGFVN